MSGNPGGVEVLGAEPVATRARATVAALQRPAPPPAPTAEPIPFVAPAPPERNQDAKHAAMLGMFEMIALLVSARVLLLLAILGAFTLALLAILHQNMLGLEVMVGFSVLVVLPVVWLERVARVEGRGGE